LLLFEETTQYLQILIKIYRLFGVVTQTLLRPYDMTLQKKMPY